MDVSFSDAAAITAISGSVSFVSTMAVKYMIFKEADQKYVARSMCKKINDDAEKTLDKIEKSIDKLVEKIDNLTMILVKIGAKKVMGDEDNV